MPTPKRASVDDYFAQPCPTSNSRTCKSSGS